MSEMPVRKSERGEIERARLLSELGRLVAWIDARMGAQVDAVLHHPRFQKLEAAWRGLAYLVGHGFRHRSIVIRMLTITHDELAKDVAQALEVDQTQLFRLIHAEEFDMPGGLPYGLLLADLPVPNAAPVEGRGDDLGWVAGLAAVGAAAFAPVIVPAAASLFGISSFSEMSATSDIEALLADGDHRRWQALRKSDEARFLGVVVPRVLMRAPYRQEGRLRHGFSYSESLARGHDAFLWGSGIYAFAARVVDVFARHGWLGDLTGTGSEEDRRGLIADLPNAPFGLGHCDGDGIGFERRGVEINLSDHLAHRLADCGFIALTPCAYRPWLAIFDCPALGIGAARGPTHTADRIAGMLPHILSLCRFAHYIKVIARDRIGSFTDVGRFEDYLGGWLKSYCIGNPDASAAQKARYPLREAQLRIRAVPGRPGALACVIHLVPHIEPRQAVVGFDLYTEFEGRVDNQARPA
ncbi:MULTISPECIES: type VI secretion system contractile sheath large subunit [unclassified Chelatococcus]|uniref:type VI secretion system contractile sheath large subunit n=1 Tax=unclassified Chelatococcus TaxID=2638111 RepID=UPI001BCC7A0B|nr:MULTISPECIES: type VI secretion system contractile sheath large subunit [unclassified Chelatococcus]MBS7697300.1 type VI secretion system contractile sheath large subunit [Chelatococcus sp. YT9]MBX3556403.1 type VI secretion system contractile sheath large subunit [Chelatococcus sp.]